MKLQRKDFELADGVAFKVANGVLVTYWPVQDFAPQPDTGLRFVEVGELDLACPACGQVSRQVNWPESPDWAE